MGTTVTNVSDAKAALSKLVERTERGERMIIGRAGKPVAMLVPWDERREPRQLSGCWRGKVWRAEDFDQLPPELAEAFGVREPE